MKLIAITGGIGSGKSVVAHVLQVMGYGVYDCDSRAKGLMTTDEEVKRQLVETFGSDVYQSDGSINREHLSSVAFGNADALSALNAIVHPATARDLQRWAGVQCAHGAPIAFVETALLRTSGLDRVVNQVWHVTAPDEVRISRVMARNGFSREQVEARIASQRIEDSVATGERIIINDDAHAALPQICLELALVRNEIN